MIRLHNVANLNLITIAGIIFAVVIGFEVLSYLTLASIRFIGEVMKWR